MSKIVCRKEQIGNVVIRTFLFLLLINGKIDTWTKSNKGHIFTASLPCEKINKLNNVGIVSFNGEMEANKLKINPNPKIYSVIYSESVWSKWKGHKNDGQ